MTGVDPRRVHDLTSLADELARLLTRAAHGTGRPRVSLANLAKRIGLPTTSKSTMHSYVTGRTLAPAEVLDSMVIALGATPAEQREWSEAWFRVAAGRRRQSATPPSDTGPEMPAVFVGRTWMFDRITAWRAGTEPILLVTGEPGAGKSTLVANIVGMSTGEVAPHGSIGPGFLAAAHFCRQQVTESVDATTVVRRLALRLCDTVPGFAYALARSAPDAGEPVAVVHTESVPRQAYDKFIRQPLRLLATGPAPLPDVVVAVDGLDEAVEGGAGFRLLTTLARESQLTTPGLRLLLTSRPGRAIHHLAAAHRIDLIDDEPEAGEDVRVYLERRLTARHVPAARVLARRIAATGKGNFLYARFVADDLLTGPGPVTLAGLRLPDGLAGLYREFLNREIAAVEPEWRQRHRPLLGLLTEARGDGLTVEQLTRLLDLPRSAVEDAVTLCAPYLRAGAGAYRIFHQSFRDYLRADGEHHVYPAEANGRLIRAQSGTPQPFREYAVRHLLRHLADPADVAKDAFLDRTLRDLSFVSAKAAADGVDTLVTEIDHAVASCGPLKGTPGRLVSAIRRQAFNLRTWRHAEHPGRFVQQLHYEATKARFPDVLALLDAPGPWLRVAWSTATDDDRTDLGHGDTISTAAVSDDGRIVVTGSYDHTVRIWDEHGGVRRVLRHPGPVQLVVMLPDGRYVASTCEDHVLYVWSLTGDRPDRQLRHADVVGPVAVTPDGRLVTGCHDGIAHVWPPGGTTPRHTFVHDDRVRSIELLADGRHAVTGSDDHTAYVWDLDTGVLRAHFDHDGPVALVRSAQDVLVTLSSDTRLTGWDVPTGTRRFIVDAPAPVRQLALMGETMQVACDREVLHWAPGEDFRPVAAHDDVIGSFAVRGDTMFTAGRDNTARVWTRGVLRHVLHHDDWVTAVVPAPDDLVVTASDDRSARRWRVTDGALVGTLAGNADSVRTVAVAGEVVVSGSDDHTVRVRDAATGRLRHTFHHDGMVRAVAVTANGVVSASDDGTVRQWDLTTGTARHVLPHNGPVRGLTLTGTRVVTGADDTLVRVWTEGRLDRVLSGHKDIVRAVAAKGNVLVSGSRDGTAIVWAPEEPRHILHHGGWVRGVALTSDGQHTVTTSTDGIVRIWRLEDGVLVAELTGHQASVRDVSLSDDDAFAVTGSMDRTAAVWDLRRHRLVHRLPHESGVRSVRITPDGTYVISTSDDRTARVWAVTTGREVHRIAAAHRIACCAIDPTGIVLGTSSGEVLRVDREH